MTTTTARPSSPSLADNPRAGLWLRVDRGGTVFARSGKVELGQGVLTALAQIVADELDVDLARVRMVPAVTGVSPDESYTSGSRSVQDSGAALRQVCAEARAAYLAAAARALGAPADALDVVDGEFAAPGGRRTSYWALADDALLDFDVTGTVAPKAQHERAVVGRSVARLDIPDKVFGRRRFIHDLRFPDQLFGRMIRPPARSATLLRLDDAPVRAIPHVVDVVRDGNVVGVLADREEVAVKAADALRSRCEWRIEDGLPDQDELLAFLRTAPATTTVLHDSLPAAAPKPVAVQRITARFSRPYLAHASLAPSCGVGRFDDGALHVWTHSQGVYHLRAALARSFGLSLDAVVVEHVEGAGCYGHNAADDAAYDAALLARCAPGRPVQVVWSREDELTWEPFGPAMAVEITADLDAAGRVQSWAHDVWSNGHTGRPGAAGKPPPLAALHRSPPVEPVVSADPPQARGGGSGRNAIPLYDLPAMRVLTHRLDTMPVRTSSLRSLGAHLNVFAIESVIDQIAEHLCADPVAYRLSLLRDERARAVLQAAAECSGWDPGTAPPRPAGRGAGFARYKNMGAYCAVVADVEAESEVRVTRLTIAVDVGLVVNPDGLANQIEGGALQAVSWTTKEQVRLDRRQITSRTWEEYPILAFPEAPSVDVVVVDRADQPSVGAGEAAMGPTAAAIGNAVYAALGVRVRTLPLTAHNVIAAIEAEP